MYKDVICMTITAQERKKKMELKRSKFLDTIVIKLQLI